MVEVDREVKRLVIQHQLNGEKTQAERNKLGQFATPPALATEMLNYARAVLPAHENIRFLDPAVGTGSFVSALFRSFPATRIKKVVGYEIDAQHAAYAINLWSDKHLRVHIADFTQAIPPDTDSAKFNLLICNPPYVRHHHLSKEDKQRLQENVKKMVGIRVSERSGLYCHFLWLAHQWLATSGLAGWLIPSEFMSVNYGQQVKAYLLDQVTLLRIHRFDPNNMQFNDALVSSSVLWFKNAAPPSDHSVEYTYGGTLAKPEISRFIPTSTLRKIKNWTRLPAIADTMQAAHLYITFPKSGECIADNNIRGKEYFSIEDKKTTVTTSKMEVSQDKQRLSDLFDIKRGLATGANNFFLLNQEQISHHQIPAEFLIPVLPNSRYITANEVHEDSVGNPVLERRLFLLSCNLPEVVVAAKYPSLWKYFQSGIEKGINTGYLCAHRTPWYSQENRAPSLFVCCYMGRQKTRDSLPFRFILNRSKAVATNAYYILYPKSSLFHALNEKPELVDLLWQVLKGISLEQVLNEGRVYGGGLHKMEPKELANVLVNNVPVGLLDALAQ